MYSCRWKDPYFPREKLWSGPLKVVVNKYVIISTLQILGSALRRIHFLSDGSWFSTCLVFLISTFSLFLRRLYKIFCNDWNPPWWGSIDPFFDKNGCSRLPFEIFNFLILIYDQKICIHWIWPCTVYFDLIVRGWNKLSLFFGFSHCFGFCWYQSINNEHLKNN